ncbi:ubiquinone/menaquinone biosynthesis C-methylase UbiE [Desulfitispora alkaliphila]|uniref:class I SAM-dependent methyltransferase n=1 Tax=Desulfitispora alkaliphila TaxID=622674 RepID=UPI003D1AB451
MKDVQHTEKIRSRYDRFARVYNWLEYPMEKMMLSKWRSMIWQEANGEILEVGVGTGKNIEFYPQGGANVTAIDFSSEMLKKAARQADKLNSKVELLEADVQELPFDDNTFDTIVATCVFCSVPNPVLGFKELGRVCKQGGKIILIEHVRSENLVLGETMDLLNSLTRLLVGVNINRRTVENLEKANLRVEQVDNLSRGDILKKIIARKR